MLANSILLQLSDVESSADARTLPPRGGQRRASHRALGPARGVRGAGLKAPRFTNRDVPQKGTWEILLNPAFSVQNSLVRSSSSLRLYLAQVNPAGTEFTRLSSTVLKRKPLTRPCQGCCGKDSKLLGIPTCAILSTCKDNFPGCICFGGSEAGVEAQRRSRRPQVPDASPGPKTPRTRHRACVCVKLPDVTSSSNPRLPCELAHHA